MTGRLKKSSSDAAHTAAKAILSAIPLAGGPLSVLFESIFSAPIDKRKDEWLVRLAESVQELTEKVDGLTPDALSKNDSFISIAMHASQVALRSHQIEKLEALQNAVTNSAIDNSIDDTKKMMFIRFIDEITPLHIKVLRFISDPTKPSRQPEQHEYRQAMEWAWNQANPEMPGQKFLVRQITRDLHSRGLIKSGGLDQGPQLKRGTTEFGEEFLSFIGGSEKT